jgi:hypothetical protein
LRYRMPRLELHHFLVFLGLAVALTPSASAAQMATVTVPTVSQAGPAEGVEVVIGTCGQLTDQEGQVLFRLPSGVCLIEARRIGFADAQVTLQLAVPRDTVLVI